MNFLILCVIFCLPASWTLALSNRHDQITIHEELHQFSIVTKQTSGYRPFSPPTSAAGGADGAGYDGLPKALDTTMNSDPFPNYLEINNKVSGKDSLDKDEEERNKHLLNTTTQTQNISDTNSGMENSQEPSCYTVMIITSVIAAAAFVALLIMTIRHFCCKNNRLVDWSQLVLPINKNRYYENITLRSESQDKIKPLEQHPRQPSEQHYEEINENFNH